MPTSICKICFEPISPSSWLHLAHKRSPICSRCHREFSPIFLEQKLGPSKVLAIYPYDEAIRERLFRLKGCYDIELAPIFLAYFNRELHRRFLNFAIVPAPSWEEDDKKREFNHVEAIFRGLNLPLLKVLRKTENVKQADLHYEQRQNIAKRIALIPDNGVRGRNILFVDDVLTSGATAQAAVSLLVSAGARSVQVLVMAKTQKEGRKAAKTES